MNKLIALTTELNTVTAAIKLLHSNTKSSNDSIDWAKKRIVIEEHKIKQYATEITTLEKRVQQINNLLPLEKKKFDREEATAKKRKELEKLEAKRDSLIEWVEA